MSASETANKYVVQNQPKVDITYSVETPEGIELNLQCAGIVIRAQAFLIDLLIRSALFLIAILVLPMLLGKVGVGLGYIVFFLLSWFYHTYFEAISDGQTPGKKRMGIQVIHTDGAPLSWRGSIVRNFFREIDFLPVFYCIGIVASLSTQRFQRVGDLIGDTLVVYHDDILTSPEIPDVEPKLPPVMLDDAQQQAIISFAERHEFISDERKIEMAEKLSSITQLSGMEAVNELYAYANWLLGKSV